MMDSLLKSLRSYITPWSSESSNIGSGFASSDAAIVSSPTVHGHTMAFLRTSPYSGLSRGLGGTLVSPTQQTILQTNTYEFKQKIEASKAASALDKRQLAYNAASGTGHAMPRASGAEFASNYYGLARGYQGNELIYLIGGFILMSFFLVR